MTITNNNNCTSITIYSSILTNYSTYMSVSLNWSHNSTDNTYTEYVVQSTDVVNGTVTLDTSFFSQQADTLADGVYCFKLVAQLESGDVEIDFGSIFLYCDMACSIAEKLWNEPESLLYSKVEAIKYQLECSSCDCASAVQMYNDLLCELGLDQNNCGC